MTDKIAIIWGDKKNAIIPQLISGKSLADLEPNHVIIQLKNQIGTHSIAFNHQTHGTAGHIIHTISDICPRFFTQEGDFIITDQPHIALGILTADCLPLILYDPEHHVIALIHAGWKGAVQGIVQQTITTLQKNFNSNPTQLHIWCGPAAEWCCYEVQDDFYTRFKDDRYANNSFDKRDNKLYFSLSHYVQAVFDTYTIPVIQRDFSANCCTICSSEYYSYRKDKKTEYRNITLVSLK